MIEAVYTWDILPGVEQAYAEWARKALGSILRQPGFVEFRANRSFLGSPQVRATYVWQTLADWETFATSAEGQSLDAETRRFVTNYRIELWGPSPVVPEPLRPGK